VSSPAQTCGSDARATASDATTRAHASQLTRDQRKTVERHRANILEKLGMRDRVQLTAIVSTSRPPLS
jgi:FixJ family two-component response regulator